MVLHKDVDLIHSFFLRDGKRMASLEDLAAALETMSVELYDFHTKEHGNDFAKWINDLYGEYELMRAVRRCTTAKSAAETIRLALNPKPAAHDTIIPEKTVVHKVEEKKETGIKKETEIKKETVLKKTNVQEKTIAQKPDAADIKKTVEEPQNAVQQETDNINKEWTDENFAPIKRDMTEKNEKLSEKYDAVIKELQMSTNDPIPKNMQELGEKLNGRYLEILAKLSEHRRAGKDMLYPALIVKQFPAKLILAKATRQEFDFAVAEQILSQTEHEIKEILEAKELNVKKEIDAIANVEELKKSMGDVRDVLRKAKSL